MALLFDTGVLYALADSSDAWHIRSRDYLDQHRDLLLVPITVLPEVTYLLRQRLGAGSELRFVEAIANGEFTVASPSAADLRRSAALMESYPDIGFVDATVVAIAERLRLPRIATTDRRHFAQIRPKHRAAFELVP